MVYYWTKIFAAHLKGFLNSLGFKTIITILLHSLGFVLEKPRKVEIMFLQEILINMP